MYSFSKLPKNIRDSMKLRAKSSWMHLFVVLAIFMGSLAPMVSQAIAFKQSNTSLDMEICSATGLKISHSVAINHLGDTKVASDEHCPLCVLQAHSPMSYQNHQTAFIQTQSQLFPFLFYHSPSPLIAWLKLPSQAPPQAFSI
jgi:Protein of unknown function (DUF2946)